MKNSSVPKPAKTGQAWTILKLLNWTASYFTSHEIEQPRATAEVLLAHTLDLKRIDLYLRYDQPLQQDELRRFKSVIKRRINAEPVAYITGEKEFWSLSLAVTPDVLIPRPETECLVEAALSLLPETADTGQKLTAFRVLDLGTGSGAIAIALASERPDARVFAVDRSPSAIRIAEKNSQRHGQGSQILFFAGDWFSAIRPAAVFDMIVSNPPYIQRGRITGLQPEIVQYEPHGALDGGPRGLDDLIHIIHQAKLFLSPRGYLLLEIGYDQREPLAQIVRSSGDYERPVFKKDYSGHDRVLQLRLTD